MPVPVPTPTPTPTPTPVPSSAYVSESLYSKTDNPAFWFFSPTVDGQGDTKYGGWNRYFAWLADGGLRVTSPACQSPTILADGTPTYSASMTGQLVGLESYVSSSQIPFVHCGYASGDPSISAYPGAVGKYEEVFYTWKQRWPAGYRPTLGTQNATAEWHFDRVSQHAFGQAVSPVVIVEGVGGTSTTAAGGVIFDTSPSTVGQVLLQFPGGGTSESGFGARTQIISGSSFKYDYWYKMACHWVFDPDASIGHCQFWVDDVKVVDVDRPTQYKRPDGSRGYQEDFGIYNYRHWANFDSSVDYKDLLWGPSAASVGLTV